MTGKMTGFRCWTAADVRQTVHSDIGSLPITADAVFLAAHTPMSTKHLKGPPLNAADSGERQVLNALLDGFGNAERNTLVAVTGGSGAGKSHIIRWVHAHLHANNERYRILYVPRAIQTLRELLRRLVTELPGVDGSDFMKRIDSAVGNISEEQFADKLLEEMRQALIWTIEERAPVPGESQDQSDLREERNSLLGACDENGKRREGLADLLAMPGLNKWILRGDGLLRRIARSGQEKTSRRDEQHVRFEAEELPSRASFAKEARSQPGLSDIYNVVSADPQTALELLDDALATAAPKAFGTRSADGDTLDSLFRRSRQALRADGLELVLLFEDLAQFGLIDGELYDQFVTPPSDDLAPLRVVYAVTTGHGKIPETVRTRVTHEFEVGDSALADRPAFLARYLNLVRIGREDIEAARGDGGADPDGWVPNACDTLENGASCRFRDQCHSGFGTVEVPGLGAVGLYPYNHHALGRALAGPEVDRSDEKHITPRRLLESLIHDELLAADKHLKQSTYPYSEITSRFEWERSLPDEELIGTARGPEAGRLLRAVVLWGAERQLPSPVVEAFGLVVMGDGVRPHPDTPRPQPSQPPREGPVKALTPMRGLAAWNDGKELADVEIDSYRTLLRDMLVARMQLDQDLYHVTKGSGKSILASIVGITTFNIDGEYGRVAAASHLRFDIERSPANVRFLFGARWWYEHGHWKVDSGNWEWPKSYQVGDIIVEVEARFDEWSEQVRQRFGEAVRGRGVASAAVGVRAIALTALGVPIDELRGVNRVLRYSRLPDGRSVQGWQSVHVAARSALNSVGALEFVNEFAAVRQGTGDPQLIDVAGLQPALHEALATPAAFLRTVAGDYKEAAPTVALAAKEMLQACESAAQDQLEAASRMKAELRDLLSECFPTAIAEAAETIGYRAMTAGMFRPATVWADFRRQVDIVRDLRLELLSDLQQEPTGVPLDDAFRLRPYLEELTYGVDALAFLRRCLKDTAAEAGRRGEVSGNIDRLTENAQRGLRQVEAFMQALANGDVA